MKNMMSNKPIDSNTKPLSGKIVIQGITEDGQSFRPRDWAEWVCGWSSTVHADRRIQYSDLLRPLMHNEIKCLLLDKSLSDSDPDLYREVLAFARQNKLKICAEEDIVTTAPPSPSGPFPDPQPEDAP